MKEMVRYGVILAVICAAASGLLAGVNLWTKPFIANQAYAQERSALEELFPSASSFEPVKEGEKTAYYKALDAQGAVIGVVFKAARKGYAGPVETMCAMDNAGTIRGIKVVSQNETPGLGSQVALSPFTAQFKGKDVGDLSGVQAIAGATISSRAVISAVEEAGRKVKESLADGK